MTRLEGKGNRLDRTNSLEVDWANTPRAYATFARNVAWRFGIDAPTFVLGYTLLTFADDGNCFYWAKTGFKPKEAEGQKFQYLTRVDWELGVKELPRSIKHPLAIMRPQIAKLDWQKEKEFEKAKGLWNAFRVHVANTVAINRNLADARHYAITMRPKIDLAYGGHA
jgi:hypothetical protein